MTQLIDIPFGSLDTKTDPTRMAPGALTLAENAVSQKPGVYTKRQGYTALASGPSAIVRLLSRQDELLAFDGTSLWTYSTEQVTAANVGAISEAMSRETPVRLATEAYQVKYSTRATANGITVHAWIDESNPCNVMVQLRDANDVVLSTKLVDNSLATWSRIHSAVAGNQVAVFFSCTANQRIAYCLVDTTTRAIGASTNYKTGANVNVSGAFDLTAHNITDVCIVWVSATPNVRAARLALGAGVVVESATAVISGETPDDAVATIVTPGEMGYCLYYASASGGTRACCFDPTTMVQTVAPFAVEAVVAAQSRATLVRYDATHALAIWAREATAARAPFIQYRTISSGGALGALKGPLNNVSVASKAWTYGGNFYVNVIANYTLQQTYFTVRLQPANTDIPWAIVTAMHAYRSAHDPTSFAIEHVPDVDQDGTVFWANMPTDVKLLDLNSVTVAVKSYGADFGDVTRLLGVEVGGAALVASGAPSTYDGQLIAEAGFLLYPSIRSLTVTAGGAGMDNGTRTYAAVFQWTTRTGDTVRSTPSLFLSATSTNGAANNHTAVKGDHLTMTFVGNANTNPSLPNGIISLYRTTAIDADTFYLIGTITMDMLSSTWTFNDSFQDATITANQIMYTAGGVVEREPPLPCAQFAVHQNRVWGLCSTDRKLLFYSAMYGPGEVPWFSSLFQVRVDVGGDIVAIASMDSHLLVFKEDRVFTIDGDGANALGQGSQLSLPQIVTGDCGCTDPRSVVTTPDGVMFRSNKGVYLINRGLQLTYMGEPADAYWTSYAEVVAANMLPDRREVRFEIATPIPPLASPDGQKVVYNYQSQQWTTHRNYTDVSAIDARVVNGRYCWATATGQVYQENDSSLDPASTYIPMSFETGWIYPAGQQGFCRVQRVNFLGDWKADHGLELQLAKDYSDVYSESVQFDRDTLNVLPHEQVSYHVHDQKGEAVRFRVSDYDDGGSPGEGFSAHGVAFLAKAIRGSFEKLLGDLAKG